MSSIAEKLAAKKAAALAAGGAGVAATSSTVTTGPQNSLNTLTRAAGLNPKTPSKPHHKASVSVLNPKDLVPQKTKETQVLFRAIKPSFNTVLAEQGKETRRIHFSNGHYLTEDEEIIAFLRKNAKHFGLVEV